MSSPQVLFKGTAIEVQTHAHGVQHLVFKRPELHNAFNEATIAELMKVLAELAAIRDEKEMRLLVLSGEGPSFCAGADLNYMRSQASQNGAMNMADARILGQMFFKLACFPTPVLASIQGAAIGGGLGLAACADFVLAERNTTFATSEVLLGIVPAVISPYIVRKVGIGFANQFMLNGKRFKAEEAYRIGLVQQLTDESVRESDMQKVVASFLKAGPNAMRRTKALLRKAAPLPDPELFQATCQAIADARMSDEGQEGLNAFFEKRSASWSIP